jgi:hypothetical protein
MSPSLHWFQRDIIEPLIDAGRLNRFMVTRAWFDDLLLLWRDARKNGTVWFTVGVQGVFTDEVATSAARSDEACLKEVIAGLKKERKACTDVIRSPLAVDTNWSRYDTALNVVMWIGAATAMIIAQLPRRHFAEADLRDLQISADTLVSTYADLCSATGTRVELLAYRRTIDRSE